MCVTTCSATSNLYGDPTTKFCVSTCPSGYYADDSTRLCVTACPATYGLHGTFADNDTNICVAYCTGSNEFADPQTIKRYCVYKYCSQSPYVAFADPSSKSCVPVCPSSPSLYG